MTNVLFVVFVRHCAELLSRTQHQRTVFGPDALKLDRTELRVEVCQRGDELVGIGGKMVVVHEEAIAMATPIANTIRIGYMNSPPVEKKPTIE